MFNLLVGILFVLGGLSGQFVLKGTDSGLGLAGVGLCLIVLGVHQFSKKRGAISHRVERG
jgi:hypothetical protein